MAAQGGANGGGFGQQGGRRGGPGFNPGFNPGFDPGFAGRGGRGYGSFPHNCGRGSNFGGGRSGYGGYGGYGSQNNYGYQGFHGANRGRRPYYGGYGGKRGRGAGYGGQQFQQQATPNPTPMGGDYGTGAHIADQMGQNLGAQQQHSTVPATGTKSATGGVPIAVTADNHLGSAVLGDPQPGHPSAGQELHQAPPAGLHKQGSKLELSPHRLVENKTTAEVPKDTIPHNPDNEPMNVDLPESSKGKFKWEIEEKGKDAFTTNFPSTVWLDTVVNWGPMVTKSFEGKIQFEKSSEEDVYKYEIEKVWLHFGVEQEAPEGEPILLDLDSKLEDEEPNEDDDPNDDDPKEEGNGDKPMDIDKKKRIRHHILQRRLRLFMALYGSAGTVWRCDGGSKKRVVIASGPTTNRPQKWVTASRHVCSSETPVPVPAPIHAVQTQSAVA
ncbi:protein argonaute 2-like [Sorghum bicolor]|uniref:protein argonaute 2-like n=1 Tax=Sorghum bicolor TaxID=4558 RepID=UPI000B425FE2|nr:protein argonaute 2-like [Sorghum bicolor]|eukprot:XP_021303717.1 protein argonaute 2-like [Sorghum bicolor]